MQIGMRDYDAGCGKVKDSCKLRKSPKIPLLDFMYEISNYGIDMAEFS